MQKESQNSGDADTEMSNSLSVENSERWDSREKEGQDSRQKDGNSKGERGTKQVLVKELFKMNEDGLSSVGRSQKPNEEAQEVTNPNKSKLKTKEDKVCNISNLDSSRK